MPRAARVVAAGFPHHVTQRGNRGGDVFITPDDHQQYLILLGQYAQRHGLRVWAYCLMTNHVHLVAVPQTSGVLAAVLRPLQMRHAQRVNEQQGWQGHIWHSRYYSCVLDEDHLWAAVRYVERNPVRAGLVPNAEEYPWSSAAPHCGLRPDPVLSPDLPLLGIVHDWTQWLRTPDSEPTLERLRTCTGTGRPCGAPSFAGEVGAAVGRDLTVKPRGRPGK